MLCNNMRINIKSKMGYLKNVVKNLKGVIRDVVFRNLQTAQGPLYILVVM